MKYEAPAALLAASLALAAPDARGADRKYPVATVITATVVSGEDNADCASARTKTREVGGMDALVSAVLPKVVDVGIASLSAALRAASGEDKKSRPFTASATTHAYSYDTATSTRSWRKENGCLLVTSAAGGTTPPFKAVVPINISNDQTAMAFELPLLTYKEKLAPGREVKEMTMAIAVTNAAGTEVARGLLTGPFLPATDPYEAKDNEAPTTGWLKLPPVSEEVVAAIGRYESLCDTRTAAAKAYVAAETAKIKASKLGKAQKAADIKALNAQFAPDAASACGEKIPVGVQSDLAYGWSTARENAMVDIQTSIETHEPITFHVTVTETRDVNTFLLLLSEKLKGDQPEIRDALLGLADPTKRREREEAQEATDAAAAKAKVIAKSKYEQDLAAFAEKARLYEVAVGRVATAQAKALAAQERAAANPGNADLEAAAAQAGNDLESARAALASALTEALAAKQAVLEAAIAAGVELTESHPVRRFPVDSNGGVRCVCVPDIARV